jgi:hypothetical protein
MSGYRLVEAYPSPYAENAEDQRGWVPMRNLALIQP